ncbi:hypothetical protein HAX54_041447, partial [Datura stramonium]|nr:hypothetical protein [Datura stramonium]
STTSIAHDSSAAKPSCLRKGKGRPKKPTRYEGKPIAKRGRGSPRKQTPSAFVVAEFATNTTPSAYVASKFASTSTYHDIDLLEFITNKKCQRKGKWYGKGCSSST